jgi:hypothetical protein
MHALISLETYQVSAKVKTMTVEERTRLQEALPFLNVPLEPEVPASYYPYYEEIVDLKTTGEKLVEFGLEFKVKRFKSCYIAAEATTNKTVNIQVAIPNLLLWSVDEVELLEDACTDYLQRRLNEGYRILAVCPPACQRRPDYILGRQRPREEK